MNAIQLRLFPCPKCPELRPDRQLSLLPTLDPGNATNVYCGEAVCDECYVQCYELSGGDDERPRQPPNAHSP